MKKYFMLIIGILLIGILAGCQNLVHKDFVMINHAKGGKITVNDPTGTNTPLPQVIFGQFTSMIVTAIIGSVIDCEFTTYQFWSEKKSFEVKIKIDATKSPIEVLRVHTDYKEPEPVEVYSKEKIKIE